MKLTEQIRAHLTEAMKSRDAGRTSTLRMLQAALKNEQIDKGHELSDEEAVAVVQRGVKQRHDSIEQYSKANREDLASKERAELEILQAYLPAQMSDDQVDAAVREVIAAVGAESKKDSGKVMKEMMARYRGQVDGKRVQEVVGRLLV
jgi:uncharacterized protein YqeY